MSDISNLASGDAVPTPTRSDISVNLTVDMKPYFLVDNISFRQGHAPAMGEVTLNLIELKGYDYNCTIVYRLWEL